MDKKLIENVQKCMGDGEEYNLDQLLLTLIINMNVEIEMLKSEMKIVLDNLSRDI